MMPSGVGSGQIGMEVLAYDYFTASNHVMRSRCVVCAFKVLVVNGRLARCFSVRSFGKIQVSGSQFAGLINVASK